MTTDSKHTPRPWDRDGLTIKSFGRGIIAECPVPQRGGVFEVSGNARLIAAAPDLLEALQNLLSTDGFQLMESESKPWQDARAAIAKATAP